MGSDIIIRPAAPGDAAGIARVHVQTWSESFRGMVPDWAIDRYTVQTRTNQWRDWLNNPEWVTIAAIKGDEIVGFACAYSDRSEPGFDVYLNTLYVLNSAQRRGVARDLLRALARDRIAAGGTAMWWLTLRANPACAFYERIGASVLRDQPAPAELGDGVMDRVFGLRDLRALL